MAVLKLKQVFSGGHWGDTGESIQGSIQGSAEARKGHLSQARLLVGFAAAEWAH